MIQELTRRCASGYLALAVLPTLNLLDGYFFYRGAQANSPVMIIAAVLAFVAIMICYKGFFMVHPNQAKVLQLFGNYVGSVRETGLRWANPFYSKIAVSLRVRNFESEVLKVNDSSGNPIKIAAVVVWKVVDSAEAMFEVDDYESYVHIQSEAALRNLATSYPYEIHGDEEIALRSSPQEIATRLQPEVQERLGKAGVEVIEARISPLMNSRHRMS
jgi:regulator of protease activity HflC (stomatin/prohibitin superfamily)